MNDYNYDYNPNPEPLDPEPAHSGMETAAIILGILALVGSTCFYLSIPCAAVGILLALLSRGRKEHMSNRAKTGLCISAAGLVLTVGLTSYTLYHYRDLFSSSEFQQRMKDYMDYYYSGSETEAEEDGESNILKDFFGDDKEIPLTANSRRRKPKFPTSMTRLMAAIPTAAVLPMEVILTAPVLTADRILPPLRDRQFKQT